MKRHRRLPSRTFAVREEESMNKIITTKNTGFA